MSEQMCCFRCIIFLMEVFYMALCSCSVQLSIFHVERCSRIVAVLLLLLLLSSSRYRVIFGTGWPGVSTLRLDEIESSISDFHHSVAARTIFSRSFPEIHRHVAETSSHQQTTPPPPTTTTTTRSSHVRAVSFQCMGQYRQRGSGKRFWDVE